MNKLLTKEIYFLMEKNTEISAETEFSKAKILKLESAVAELIKGGRHHTKSSRPSRREIMNKNYPSPSGNAFVTIPKADTNDGSLTQRGIEEERRQGRTIASNFVNGSPKEMNMSSVALASSPLLSSLHDLEERPPPHTLREPPPLGSNSVSFNEDESIVEEEKHTEVEEEAVTIALPPHLVPEEAYIDQELLL